MKKKLDFILSILSHAQTTMLEQSQSYMANVLMFEFPLDISYPFDSSTFS